MRTDSVFAAPLGSSITGDAPRDVEAVFLGSFRNGFLLAHDLGDGGGKSWNWDEAVIFTRL
jgi:hypothetical protein